MPSDLNFDATGVQPNARPDPLPAGEYRMAITGSEVKPTSTGSGKMLKIELVVLDEPFKGRKVFDNLNIQNANPEAQRIAHGQLSAICHATGVLQLMNSFQLHNIPMLVRIAIKQSPGYDPQNVVKGYKGILAAPGSAPASPAAAPAPAAPSANAPAWARKAS